MSKEYKPAPIDVSEIELPPELIALAEKLAENVHEIWAAERISAGWSYGSVRDDFKKETPCLVEYSVLPENEKIYDWKIIEGTLKTILKLGYTISRADSADSD